MIHQDTLGLRGYDYAAHNEPFPYWWLHRVRRPRALASTATQVVRLATFASADVWENGGYRGELARSQSTLAKDANGRPVMSMMQLFLNPIRGEDRPALHTGTVRTVLDERPDLTETLLRPEPLALISWHLLFKWYAYAMTGSILTTALSVADLEEGADTYLVSPDVIPGWAAAYADVALTRLVHGPATMIDSLDAQGRAMSRRGVPVPPFA